MALRGLKPKRARSIWKERLHFVETGTTCSPQFYYQVEQITSTLQPVDASAPEAFRDRSRLKTLLAPLLTGKVRLNLETFLVFAGA